MYPTTILWILTLGLQLAYSYNFSYRDVLDRPLKFAQLMAILRLVEVCLLIVVVYLALARQEALFAFAAIAVSFGGAHLVRRKAYAIELNRMARVQVEGNNFEWGFAIEIAKRLLDRQIRNGEKLR